MKSFTGIGSRKTPPNILVQMGHIGQALVLSGWICRTGGAPGADTAFETVYEDVGGKLELYLPWKGFNNRQSGCFPSPESFRLAKKYHPNWSILSRGGRCLMARNGHQVLGPFLDDPVKFIVCWTVDGLPSGGTGQALRVAADYGIKAFNLFNSFNLGIEEEIYEYAKEFI